MRNHLHVIVHLGANMLTDDGADLAGAISHYARIEDAVKHHKFVRSVAGRRSYTAHDRESLKRAAFDYLGHQFQDAPSNFS